MPQEIDTKTCPVCQEKFSFRKNKIYCSDTCRFKLWAKEHPRIRIKNNESMRIL